MPVDRSIKPETVRTLGLNMKAELRKSMMRTRGLLPREQRAEWSRAIAERVMALPVWQRARTVALFRTIASKGEIDTALLDERARSEGKRVAYPIIDGDGAIEEASMGFCFVDDPAALRARGRGFAEPPRDAERALVIDVIVVPGLAFDETGYRVGYGAGLYDRALAATTGARVGVAFDFQLVMEVPRQEHDVPVSWVVTDKRVVEVER